MAKLRQKFVARLGGAWHPDFDTNPHLQTWHTNRGYVFIDLPNGEHMQLFYNAETRLLVADVTNHNSTRGNEFVRITVPKP